MPPCVWRSTKRRSEEDLWKVYSVNRWIELLPGTWMGRWRDLKLKGDDTGEADREQFVGHVRAVIAFLEASRTPAPRSRKWWSLRRRSTTASRPPRRRQHRPVRPPSRSIFSASASRCRASTDAASIVTRSVQSYVETRCSLRNRGRTRARLIGPSCQPRTQHHEQPPTKTGRQ